MCPASAGAEGRRLAYPSPGAIMARSNRRKDWEHGVQTDSTGLLRATGSGDLHRQRPPRILLPGRAAQTLRFPLLQRRVPGTGDQGIGEQLRQAAAGHPQGRALQQVPALHPPVGLRMVRRGGRSAPGRVRRGCRPARPRQAGCLRRGVRPGHCRGGRAAASGPGRRGTAAGLRRSAHRRSRRASAENATATAHPRFRTARRHLPPGPRRAAGGRVQATGHPHQRPRPDSAARLFPAHRLCHPGQRRQVFYGGADLVRRYGAPSRPQGFRFKFRDRIDGKPVFLYVAPETLQGYPHRRYLEHPRLRRNGALLHPLRPRAAHQRRAARATAWSRMPCATWRSSPVRRRTTPLRARRRVGR